MNLPAVSGHGTGYYKGSNLHIYVNPAVAPAYQQDRSVVFAITTKMEETIAANVKRGALIPVKNSGPWASAIVPVLKCNGTCRLCADYKGTVNHDFSSDTNKSPTVDQVLSELAGGCINGTIDLEEAYTQIPVDGETSHVLTVNTVQGLLKSLQHLLNSKCNWAWTTKHQVALQMVQDMLISHQVLAHYNPDLGLCGLVQCWRTSYQVLSLPKQEICIAFASRTLSTTERAYSPLDREVLVTIFVDKMLTPYYAFCRFTIITGPKNLLGMFAPDRPHCIYLYAC
ncbi:hypothetical protein PR048_001268 [Dryococelus australis]|uniref:Reverse transcriptase/retrotransposon-derived protein RNase H-like domain-containing protein n=1 Tax=Dryococelus australis TaxID=614101 RepID=A0ABQ9IHJ3_9NEOP|nr:hypothetical protein PR048_001268 [Dryococelus australis]